MKQFSYITKSCLFIAAFLFAISMAYSSSPKMPVVEEFTNASCGPCASANPNFQALLIQKMNQCIPIVFHPDFPGMDVMNAANPTMNNGRTDYYQVGGVPHAYVNGNYLSDHPANTDGFSTAIDQISAMTSPITISVKETRTGPSCSVEVTVSSDEEIVNKKLRVVVVEYFHYYAQAGYNGETDFNFVARKMLPDHNGQTINIAAGGSQQFTLDYIIPTSEWTSDQLYIAAFIQDDATKEILQGGTNIKYGNIFAFENPYLKVQRSKEYTQVAKVYNQNAEKMTFDISLDNDNSNILDGWTATITPKTLTLNPGDTGEVTVTYNTGANAGCAWFSINSKPRANSFVVDGKQAFYTLTEDTKFVIYSGWGIGDAINAAAFGNLTKYNKDYAVIPLLPDFLTNYPPTDFKFIHIASTYAGRGLLGGAYTFSNAVFNTVRTMIEKGRKVLITSEISQYLAFNGGSVASQNFYTDELGLQSCMMLERFTTDGTNITGFVAFPVKGKSGDKIAAGLNFTLNQYNSTSHPYFTLYSDILNPTDPNTVIPFMYYDDDDSRTAAVRFEKGRSRVVYMSFGIEQINNQTQRNNFYNKIITWLFEKGLTNGPETQFSTGDLNFGTVNSGETKDMDVVVTNIGDEKLTITEVKIDWDDLYPGVFSVYNPPTTPFDLEPEASATFTVRFAPNEKVNYTGPVFKVLSNAVNGDEEIIILKGNGGQAASNPKLVTNVDENGIDFGKVKPNTTATTTFIISNGGNADLTIYDVYFNINESNAFGFEEEYSDINIIPGGEKEIIVKFTPTQEFQEYNGKILIQSNDNNNINYDFDVVGIGDELGDVALDSEGNVILSVNVGPNPFTKDTKINLTLGTKEQRNIELFVIDASGREIAKLMNEVMAPGTIIKDFDGSSLSSGTYYVIARTNGVNLQIPIVLVK